MIVEEPPVREAVESAAVDGGPVPVVVSGQSEAGLREQAARWADWLTAHPDAGVADVAVTAARHRSHFGSRAGVVASD
ncbi:CurL C-terminal domain-containing protein, partial [Streptomyces sp. ECR2.10]|uniref:CurL C-terminal domain-containing protein n=1 Tax=Streptomyces sp. ECR2.10 TaxID=3461012 RepID=UPI004042DF03